MEEGRQDLSEAVKYCYYFFKRVIGINYGIIGKLFN